MATRSSTWALKVAWSDRNSSGKACLYCAKPGLSQSESSPSERAWRAYGNWDELLISNRVTASTCWLSVTTRIMEQGSRVKIGTGLFFGPSTWAKRSRACSAKHFKEHVISRDNLPRRGLTKSAMAVRGKNLREHPSRRRWDKQYPLAKWRKLGSRLSRLFTDQLSGKETRTNIKQNNLGRPGVHPGK